MPNEEIAAIADYYGLKIARIFNPQSGYRNKNYRMRLTNGDDVNLIIYKREPNIRQTVKNAHYVAEYLHKNDFPARSLYDKRILRLRSGANEQLAALYFYLPGKTIPWEAYTMKHLKQLGLNMSNMHSILKDLPKGELEYFQTVYSGQLARIMTYLKQPGVKDAMARKLGITFNAKTILALQDLINLSSNLPNQQPIHLDFVRGNVLFEENSPTVTGVLDFEKSLYGNPIFDIARTLAFLYVDCKYKNTDKIYKYFLTSGYNKYGNASYAPINLHTVKHKINVLDESIKFFLLYDFYKFLKHNPYEYLHLNEHYVRTKNILVEHRILANHLV